MTKMQTETQAVYNKYGVSPFGGCLPLLISMPIMFALYGVIQRITEYVPSLKGTTGFLGLDVSQTPTQYAQVTKLAYLIPILAVVFQFINTKMLQVKDTNKNKQQDSMADEYEDDELLYAIYVWYILSFFEYRYWTLLDYQFYFPYCPGIFY